MFSELANSIEEAGSIRVNQLVYDKRRKNEDVVVLSLGEALFDIPMFDFKGINFEAGYHYADSRGLPELRERIAEYYAHYDVKCDPNEQILVTTGSKMAIYLSLLATVDPGDEVLVQEPYWLSYPEQVRLCRGVTKVIPYWEKGEDFKKYFTKKTKMLILNNPNNPAGRTYSLEELSQIYKICREANAYLMVDEAYSDFCLNKEFHSAGVLDKDFQNIIIVNSLSKNMGMSGWRLGYVIAGEALINMILRLNQHTITCAPTVLMSYAAKYFKEILDCTLPQVHAVVRKREEVKKFMESIKLEFLGGATTFYFFVNIEKSGRTSEDFSEWLLKEHNIAVVPGSCYGQNTDKFVRVGVGTETIGRIQAALRIIKTAAS